MVRYDFVMSGQGTTNDYSWGARLNTADYSETIVAAECLGGNSGVRYAIRGYLVPGTKAHAIASGTLTSGGYVRLHSGLHLNESIQIGVASEVAGESGLITIYSLHRGRAT